MTDLWFLDKLSLYARCTSSHASFKYHLLLLSIIKHNTVISNTVQMRRNVHDFWMKINDKKITDCSSVCLNIVTATVGHSFLPNTTWKFKLRHPKICVLFNITKVMLFSQYFSSFWPSLKAHRTNSQVLHLGVCKCGCLCVWVSHHSTFICGLWLHCLRFWNNISSASSTESSSWREKKEIWEISVRAFSLSPFKDSHSQGHNRHI